MTRTPHEELFTTVLGHLPYARAWLLDVLPPEVSCELDWDTLMPAEGRVLGVRLRRNAGDRVFSVRRRGAPEGDDPAYLVLIVVEHKSGPSADMVGQQLRYNVHLRHAHRRNRRSPPFVLSVMLFHGGLPLPARQFGDPDGLQSVDVSDDLPLALRAFAPRLRLCIDDLTRQLEEGIRARRLPTGFCLVLLCLCSFPGCTQQELLAAIDRFGDLLCEVGEGEDGGMLPATILDAIAWYAVEVTDVTEEQIEMALRKHVSEHEVPYMTTGQRIRSEARTQGRQEGRQEGRLEGVVEGGAAVLARQLERRFGPLHETVRERLLAASKEDLERYADRVLDARTLEDVFAPL